MMSTLCAVRDRNIAATIGTNNELTLEFVIIINEYMHRNWNDDDDAERVEQCRKQRISKIQFIQSAKQLTLWQNDNRIGMNKTVKDTLFAHMAYGMESIGHIAGDQF